MNNDSRSGRTLQIAILGAGAGGLCAAVKLKEAGINDFVILEKASGLGGTLIKRNQFALVWRIPHRYLS